MHACINENMEDMHVRMHACTIAHACVRTCTCTHVRTHTRKLCCWIRVRKYHNRSSVCNLGLPTERFPCFPQTLGTLRSGTAKKAKEKRGMVQCRGCKKKFNYDDLRTASAFCQDCKRALDRLRIIADAEGGTARDAFKQYYQSDVMA